MPSTKRVQSTRDRVMVTVLMAGVFIATMGGAYAISARSVQRVEVAGLSVRVPQNWREVEVDMSRDLLVETRVFQAGDPPARTLWIGRLRLDALLGRINAPPEKAMTEFIAAQWAAGQPVGIVHDEAGERYWLIQITEPRHDAMPIQNRRLVRLIEQSARVESE